MKPKLRKLVIWNSLATTKAQLFDQVADELTRQGLIPSPAELVKTLNQRETAGSTMIDSLLATPHAQTNLIKQNTLVLVQTRVPIAKWDGASDAQTFIFCCIRKDIGPTNAHEMIQTLKQAVALGMPTIFQQATKAQIIEKLNFTE